MNQTRLGRLVDCLRIGERPTAPVYALRGGLFGESTHSLPASLPSAAGTSAHCGYPPLHWSSSSGCPAFNGNMHVVRSTSSRTGKSSWSPPRSRGRSPPGTGNRHRQQHIHRRRRGIENAIQTPRETHLGAPVTHFRHLCRPGLRVLGCRVVHLLVLRLCPYRAGLIKRSPEKAIIRGHCACLRLHRACLGKRRSTVSNPPKRRQRHSTLALPLMTGLLTPLKMACLPPCMLLTAADAPVRSRAATAEMYFILNCNELR